MKKTKKESLLKYIHERQYVTSKELQQSFDVSLMTITRWLNELSDDRQVKKIHGGAISLNSNPMLGPDFTHKKQLEQKKKIAYYANANFIQVNETYFFEAGGTVYEMLPFIQEKSITIITNAIHIIHSITQYIPEISVLSTGGIVRPQSMSIVGDVAESTLNNFHAHALFFSGQAVSEKGVLDSDLFESVIKRKMASQSDKVILLADYSKMNTTSAELVLPFDHIDILVTDKMPPKNIEKILDTYNVEIHVAPEIQ